MDKKTLAKISIIAKKRVGRFDLFFWEKIGRFRYIRNMAKQRLKVVGSGVVTAEQKKAISDAWGFKYKNSSYFKLYANYSAALEGVSLADYVPDHYYMDRVEPFFNNPLLARKNEDKNLYDMFFGDINMPHTLIRYVDGVFLNDKYAVISENEAVRICDQYNEVIIKSASESGGGFGVSFWNSSHPKADLLKQIKNGNNMIVQELVKQHLEMSRLHESSVNTLRIMTVLFEGEVHVMTHFVRMGVKGKRVDNVSSGGMLCGINPDGTLQEIAFDDHGRPYKSHPTSGIVFKGFTVPSFQKCLELVKKAAPRLSHFSKLISWDIAITEDGDPILIEANLTYCDIGIYQIACGPLFGHGELKERIIKAVRNHK